jgi:hypothetical protein
VTVSGVADEIADGDVSYGIVVGPFASVDRAYEELSSVEVAVINRDIDTAGLVATPTQLRTSEFAGVAAGEFKLRLKSKPTADVAVTVTIPASAAGEGAFEGEADPLSATVTFTASNWDEEQALRIRGVDDDLVDGDVEYELGFGVVSTDATYAGLSELPSVRVTNEDDETANLSVNGGGEGQPALRTTELGGEATFEIRLSSQPRSEVIIAMASTNALEGTVTPESLTFTPENWSVVQTVTITGVDDEIADGDVSYEITLGPIQSEDTDYAGLALKSVSVINEDNDAASIVVSPATLVTIENGEAVEFTVVLSSQPTAEVVMSVTSGDEGEGTVEPTELTFTSENWNEAQTVTVTPVNDDLADGAQSYAVEVSVTSNEDASYAGQTTSVSVTNEDDDVAGLMVAPTSLVTIENGESVEFTVALTAEPTGEVTIAIESSDLSEGTASPSTLTFTPENWSVGQPVTVTPMNDELADGPQSYAVVLSVEQTADADYEGQTTSVSVTNQDDDSANLMVNPTELTTVENGEAQTFTVTLTTQPADTLTVGIVSADVTEGTVAPASLTFTSANWNVAQTVTVTPVDDLNADGSVDYDISLSASGSAEYAGVSASVRVTNHDDDVASLLLSETRLSTSEGGSAQTFTVALSSEPMGEVTVAIESADETEGTVAPASLTFTSANWNVAQAVTVTPVDDQMADGSVEYAVSLSASGSSEYEGKAVSIRVTNADDDEASLVVSPVALTTSEGGSAQTFTVALSSEPMGEVTVAIVSADVTEGTVAPASLTFTSENWNEAQTVTVMPVDDLNADGSVDYDIS